MSSNEKSSTIYSQDISNYSTRASSIFLSISIGLGICFILITLFYVCFSCGRRSQVSTRASVDEPNNNRNGFTVSDVNSLPTFEYKRFDDDSNGGRGWAQCSVCLNLVQEGEKVRQLSNCKHLFHPECIDMWLYSHSTCPLCRSTVNAVHGESRDESSQVSIV